jgi:colicin import membrane protein
MSFPLGRPGLTAADVAGAADRLVLRGERATAQAIRNELGSGSLGTIQRHLTTWRESQRSTSSNASQALPDPLNRALLAHIEVSVQEARAQLSRELTETQSERDALATELERQAESLVGALQQNESLATDLARQTGARAELERTLQEARIEIATSREAAELARQTAALAEQRLGILESLQHELLQEREVRRQAEIEAAELRGRLQQPE